MTSVVAKQLHLPNLMKDEGVSADGKECQDDDLDPPDPEPLSLPINELVDDQPVENGSDDNQQQQPNTPKPQNPKNMKKTFEAKLKRMCFS
jgi:hypothetical protein